MLTRAIAQNIEVMISIVVEEKPYASGSFGAKHHCAGMPSHKNGHLGSRIRKIPVRMPARSSWWQLN
jgi:hypothetical protein